MQRSSAALRPPLAISVFHTRLGEVSKMTRSRQNVAVLLVGVLAVAQALVFSSTPAEADASDLDPDFYSTTCPDLQTIISDQLATAIQTNPRLPAAIVRIFFHDCFVGGCDASILLDPPANNASDTEKDTGPNRNSITEYPAIDTMKAAVESACPGIVSCADIIALAAMLSVVQTGGPSWAVPMGRRDSLNIFLNTPQSNAFDLINPNANITTIKDQYAKKNLSNVGAVALSGAHTIGLVRCTVLQQRLYNFDGFGARDDNSDPNINATLLEQMKALCPLTTDSDAGNVTQGLDLQTNQTFDNFYFQNLLLKNGKLFSDEQLFVAADDTAALVQQYADDQDSFFSDFADSMVIMGNANVTTGDVNEVRLNCRVVNSANSGGVIQEAVEKAVHEDSPMLRVFQKAVEKVVEDMDALATAGEEVGRVVEEAVDGALHPSY